MKMSKLTEIVGGVLNEDLHKEALNNTISIQDALMIQLLIEVISIKGMLQDHIYVGPGE
jgi:hypothetical protein